METTKKEFKGTKGEWFTRISGYGDYISVEAESGIKQSDNRSIIYKTFKPDDEESEYYKEWKANAQLIASAPKLLEALQETNEIIWELLEQGVEGSFPIRSQFDKNQSSISSALGE